MSPPTEPDRLAALARLTGAGAEVMPPEGIERDRLALRLIGDAIGRRVSWAEVGEAMGGLPPKLAKREARLLGRALAAGRRHPWLVPGQGKISHDRAA